MNDHQRLDCRPAVVPCVSLPHQTLHSPHSTLLHHKVSRLQDNSQACSTAATTGTDCDPSSHQCAGINNHRRTQALLTSQHEERPP